MQVAAQRHRRKLLDRLAEQGALAQVDEGDQIWRGVSGDVTFNPGQRLYEPRPWALEELTEQKFHDHLAKGEVLHWSNEAGKAVAILTADVPAAEDAALRLALAVGIPETAFELFELARRSADDTLRFRYPQNSPLVDQVRQSYVDAGWELSDWAMHIMARVLDATHPAPAVDPEAVVLDDPPEAVITPPR